MSYNVEDESVCFIARKPLKTNVQWIKYNLTQASAVSGERTEPDVSMFWKCSILMSI